MLYGSDWPHPEGLAEPTHYVDRARAPLRRGSGEDHGRQPRTPRHGVTYAATLADHPRDGLERGGPFRRRGSGRRRSAASDLHRGRRPNPLRRRCIQGPRHREGRAGRRLGAELRGVDDRGVRVAHRGRCARSGQHPVQDGGSRRHHRPQRGQGRADPEGLPRQDLHRARGRAGDRPEVRLPFQRFTVRARCQRHRHLRHHLHVGHHRQAQGRDDESPPEPSVVRRMV